MSATFACMFENAEQVYNKLNTYFHAIVALPMLVYGIIFLQADKGGIDPLFRLQGNQITMAVFAGLIILTIYFLFRIRNQFRGSMAAISQSANSLKVRVTQYYTVSLKTHLLLSVPALVGLVGYSLTFFHGFTAIYLLSVFTMSFFRPSTHHICEDLRLSKSDREIVISKKPFPEEEGSTN